MQQKTYPNWNRPTPNDLAKLIIAFFVIITIAVLFGCTSSKKLDEKAKGRVLASPDLKEQIGREWEKVNPCKNVITKMLPGAVIREPYPVEKLIKALDTAKMVQFYDSLNKVLRLKYNEQQKDCSRQVNEAFQTGYNQAKYELSKQLQDTKLPDTAWYEDTRRINIYNDSMNYYKGLYIQKTAEAKEYRQERNKNRLYLWLFIAAALLYAGFQIKRMFTPAIKLSKVQNENNR